MHNFVRTEWELNRRWLYSEEVENPVGETNFVISNETLRQILATTPSFGKYANIGEFFECYIPEIEGEYVYQQAKALDAIIEDRGIVHYDGWAANEVKITLLTEEQAEKLPPKMLEKGAWWWLRSPDDFYCATIADYNGLMYYNSADVGNTRGGVVPVFEFPSLRAKIGDKVYVGKLRCTVIGENLALADKVVCEHCYDEKSSDWETSELKAFIESDEFLDEYVKF